MKTTTPHRVSLTVPEIARQYGVNQSKVLAWIHDDELRAINVASAKATRPRWRISPDDLADFEAGRSNTTSTTTTKRPRPRSRRYR